MSWEEFVHQVTNNNREFVVECLAQRCHETSTTGLGDVHTLQKSSVGHWRQAQAARVGHWRRWQRFEERHGGSAHGRGHDRDE